MNDLLTDSFLGHGSREANYKVSPFDPRLMLVGEPKTIHYSMLIERLKDSQLL